MQILCWQAKATIITLLGGIMAQGLKFQLQRKTQLAFSTMKLEKSVSLTTALKFSKNQFHNTLCCYSVNFLFINKKKEYKRFCVILIFAKKKDNNIIFNNCIFQHVSENRKGFNLNETYTRYNIHITPHISTQIPSQRV